MAIYYWTNDHRGDVGIVDETDCFAIGWWPSECFWLVPGTVRP